jgi:hypothetical protein
MKNISTTCDKCGDVIPKDASVVKVEAGPLRLKRDQPIDLCPGCSDRFDEWLRSRHQADQGEAWNELETKLDDSPAVKKRRTASTVEAAQ